MTVASLGFEIRSQEAVKAKGDLDRLTAASAKAEAAAKSLAGGTNTADASLKKMTATANAEAAALTRASAAATGMVNRNAEFARGLQTTKLATANVGYQLQDIGVQLAAGQSPFMIAIQQGTQLNQVLGNMGARGAISALGGAFAGLINPVSLATIAIIGLGGTAVQYFTNLLSDAEDSEEALKTQADLIQKVADKWGDALPSLKAYADEQRRLAEEAEKRQAIDLREKDIWKPLKDNVEEVRASVIDLATQIGNIPEYQHGLVDVQRSFESLTDKVKDGKAETEDLDRVMASLTALFEQSGLPIVSGLADRFSDLADQIKRAAGEAAQLNTEASFEQHGGTIYNPVKKTTSLLPQLDPLGFINPDRDQTNRANSTKSQYQIDQERAARQLAKSTAKQVSDIDRQRQSVKDLISQLEFENSLIGKSGLEREQATALRKAGAAATDEQRAKIEQLVAATYTEKQAIEQQQEAYKTLQRVGETALNGLVTAMADGKITGKELLSILIQVAQQLLTMKNIGGSGGGGLFGSIISGIGSLFAPSDPWAGLRLPGNANGTDYWRGGPTRINEQGGEVIDLPRGTRIIPHDVSMRMATANNNQQPAYNDNRVYQIDARGAQQGVGEEIVAAIKAYDKGRLGRLKADLPNLRRRSGSA